MFVETAETEKIMANDEKIMMEFSIPSKRLVVKHAQCPNGHFLNTEEVIIGGHPSVKVKIKVQNKGEGTIYLDPVYGSYNNMEKGIQLEEGDIAEFFCPECGVSLKYPEEYCQACSAPMFYFQLPHGSIVEGCSRKGCTSHKLKLVTAEEQMGRLFDDSTLESFL
jgi:hypothetical protein